MPLLTPDQFIELGRWIASYGRDLGEYPHVSVLDELPAHLRLDLDPPVRLSLEQLMESTGFMAIVSDASSGRKINTRVLEERLQGLYGPELVTGLMAFVDGFCCAWATAEPCDTGVSAYAQPSPQDVTVAVGIAVLTGLLGAVFIAYQAFRSFGQSVQDDPITQELLRTSKPKPASTPSGVSSGRLSPAPSTKDRISLGSPQQLSCLAAIAPEQLRPAASSNYGKREPQDWKGQPVEASPSLIVLHETVVDEFTTLDLFSRYNPNDSQQASYHVVIAEDGRRLRVVDDSQRAFGAGDSVFNGRAVKLKPDADPSVNNFALHVSLVTPADGRNGEARSHSGYTESQYRALAAQVAYWVKRYGINPAAITTHADIDQSGTRRDPRSFDFGRLSKNFSEVTRACP
jgi:N-acetylmuramoyl-L-alanine amidase